MISPCLCNVYLHRLDRQWAERGHGVLVRYADDLLAMCTTNRKPKRPRGAHRDPRRAGLELKDGQDADRALARGRRGRRFPRLPSSLGARQHPAVKASHVPRPLALTAGDGHARDRIGRSPTAARLRSRSRRSCRTSTGSCAVGRATSVTETPPGSSPRSRSTPTGAWRGRASNGRTQGARVTRSFIAKRHQRRERTATGCLAQTPRRIGVISLAGTVVAPRPHRAWRQGAECRR